MEEIKIRNIERFSDMNSETGYYYVEIELGDKCLSIECVKRKGKKVRLTDSLAICLNGRYPNGYYLSMEEEKRIEDAIEKYLNEEI